MFPKLQNKFRRSNFQPSLPVKREGYFTPQNHQSLLGTATRQAQLKKIWQSSLLSKSTYDEFCLKPLQNLAERYQNLPAARIADWNNTGGLLDLTLQQIVTTLQLSKGMVFPANAAPEDQAAQSSHWNCVVFWLALFWHVPELLHIEAELEDGHVWQPISNAPGMQFRFRVDRQTEAPAKDSVIRLAFAVSMLPKSAINWLEKQPNVRDCLFLELAGINSAEKQIHSLLKKVRQKSLPDELNNVSILATINPNLHQEIVSELPAKIPAEQYDDAVYEEYFSQIDVKKNSHLTNGEIEISAEDYKKTDHGADITEFHIQNGSRITANNSDCAEIPTYGSSESDQKYVNDGYQTQPHDQESIPVTPEMTSQISKKQIGETFWSWLVEGLENGTIACNEADSRVQLVAGFVFLLVPGIFYRYLKQTGQSADERENVQAGFERLNRHRRNNGKRFTFATLYNSADRNGPYKRVKGYLVKSTMIIRSSDVPDDSQFLVVP